MKLSLRLCFLVFEALNNYNSYVRIYKEGIRFRVWYDRPSGKQKRGKWVRYAHNTLYLSDRQVNWSTAIFILVINLETKNYLIHFILSRVLLVVKFIPIIVLLAPALESYCEIFNCRSVMYSLTMSKCVFLGTIHTRS